MINITPPKGFVPYRSGYTHPNCVPLNVPVQNQGQNQGQSQSQSQSNTNYNVNMNQKWNLVVTTSASMSMPGLALAGTMDESHGPFYSKNECIIARDVLKKYAPNQRAECKDHDLLVRKTELFIPPAPPIRLVCISKPGLPDECATSTTFPLDPRTMIGYDAKHDPCAFALRGRFASEEAYMQCQVRRWKYDAPSYEPNCIHGDNQSMCHQDARSKQ